MPAIDATTVASWARYATLRQYGKDGRNTDLRSFFDHQIETRALWYGGGQVQTDGTLPPLQVPLHDLRLYPFACHPIDSNAICTTFTIDHIDHVPLSVPTDPDMVGLLFDQQEAITIDGVGLDKKGSRH